MISPKLVVEAFGPCNSGRSVPADKTRSAYLAQRLRDGNFRRYRAPPGVGSIGRKSRNSEWLWNALGNARS